MIALGQRRHVEFCFVLKPSPGSRILDLVPHKQIPDIEDMRFITDSHLLVRLKKRAVFFYSNGTVLHQQNRSLRDIRVTAQSDLKSHWYKEGPSRDQGITEIWNGLQNMFDFNNDDENKDDRSISCFLSSEDGVFKVLNDGSAESVIQFDDLEHSINTRLHEHYKWSLILADSNREKNKRRKHFEIPEIICEHDEDK